jgi:predicted peroxiredoxin
MKTLFTAATLAVATLGLPAAAQEAPDTLVTVLTTPEPQTQLMAMVLTMQAVGQGKSAHVLLCGPAADIALKEAPDSATAAQPPKGMSPQGLMQMIMSKPNTKVEVCAIYLPAKGAQADALLDGVTVADPAKMAAALMAPNARVASY